MARKATKRKTTEKEVSAKEELVETSRVEKEEADIASCAKQEEKSDEASCAKQEEEAGKAPRAEQADKAEPVKDPLASAPAPAKAPAGYVAHSVASANHPLMPPPGAATAKKAKPVRGEWQSVTGRDVAALLDPRPTLVVGSIGRRDEVGFATIIWATPISHNPSMVAFSLRERSHTMGCLQKSGCFSLNILPATPEGIECCEQCGTRTGYQFNKIVVVKHHLLEIEYDKTEIVEVEVPKKGIFRKTTIEEAERTSHIKGRVPIVDCATSWLACDVDHIEEAGDHLLVIGNVIEAQTCAVRNENGLLVPQDVLECVQHGCYAKPTLLEEE